MGDNDDAGRDGHSIEGDSFVVLVNAEGQHSVWPSAKPTPDGWSQAAPAATRAACNAFVEASWTDMRPQTLRAAMSSNDSRTE